MSDHLLRLVAAGSAILLAVGLLAGCGGSTASVVKAALPTSGPITKTQAVAYAHAVNLRAGDVPGFAGSGGEREATGPTREGLEYIRCRGGVNPARRIADIYSTELSAETGHVFYAKSMQSAVEVWPTPALAASNNTTSQSSRGRACLVRFFEAIRTRINRENKGRRQHGAFTITTVSNPLPGVSHSFLTTINETRLLRTGAIRAHIYRDRFAFVSGAAEIELEAVGFGHRVPVGTEQKALRLLLSRVRAEASDVATGKSS
jgi:hypothetical protein